MKKSATILVFIIALISFHVCNAQTNNDLKLWYNKPAAVWEEALPIGNGRLGAMIFGAPAVDHVQFNEETLWAGEPHDYSYPGAFKYLGEIRDLIWQGRQKDAEDLALKKFMSLPIRQQKYQPFGDLWLSFPGHLKVEKYKRELDLSNAVCRTTYSIHDTAYTREYIASYPGNVIAINLSADRKSALTFDIIFTSLHESTSVVATSDGYMTLNIKVKEGVLTGTAMLKVIIKGGKISANDNRLHVEKASEAMVQLVAATSFLNPKYVFGDPDARCSKYLADLGTKSFRKLKSEHISDYQRYFNRFVISFGPSGKEDLPTDARIREVADNMDNSLAALYVQYGRYLMLSASREGTYPANLQGIWNDKLNPSWDSKYTVNINTEMNYGLVEPLNIAECHEALFKMINEVIPSGEKVAKEHYNARGWVLHHNTDIWRGAAPINASNHGIWVSGSGWLSHHLWEHFLYNRDKLFLSLTAWPVMKGAAMFYVDFLVEDPKTGWLISTPSNSPENGGLVAGPTMDHEIIKSLFRACIEASEILGRDKEFADTLKLLLPKIAPYQIGKFGQLQEWLEDKDDQNNKHRHVSHLWGVHPGKEINWKETPELMEAAKKSLIARGDEGTGWSLAWKINFWARFRDGNHAWKMVQMLLRPQGQSKSVATGGGNTGGGSYPNLFDAHPPFQIDGNFGGAAGITEMLLQSHLDAIDILPALPDAIPNGYIKGIRARGGFELEIGWTGGELYSVKVISNAGYPLSLRYADKSFSSPTKKRQVLKFDGDLKRL
ncbi:MAG: glycoside hydrolase family 95 protein [Bacteroidia bacterium]|nr:glycoside hydrolase family 95 protein [Bacteroidia bacterium]